MNLVCEKFTMVVFFLACLFFFVGFCYFIVTLIINVFIHMVYTI